MANILEVYKKYRITESLQEHHLRVAAVAEQICDSLTVPVDTETVIKACLLHDTGNILKFDFNVADSFFEPEGKEYWKKAREEIENKYQTNDEHRLNLIIAKELGASQRVLECIDAIGFSMAVRNAKSKDMEAKICDYADTRVSPQGVVSVEQRLEEGYQRYKNHPNKGKSPKEQKIFSDACYVIEEQVFKNSKIKPSDITDGSVAPIIERLKQYNL